MYTLRQQAANLSRAGSHTLPARCSEPAPVLLSATRLVPPTKETRGRTETVYSCHPPGCYQYLPRLLSPVRFPVVGRLKCVSASLLAAPSAAGSHTCSTVPWIS